MRYLALGIFLAAALLTPAAFADWSWQTFELVPVNNSAVLPGADPLVPDFNDGSYFTFDLMILNHNTYFSTAVIGAALTGPSEFFLHPDGDLRTPAPELVAQYPALEYDTFFEGGPGAQIDFLFPTIESQYMDVTWYAWDDHYYSDDPYRIARFSFQLLEHGTATFTLEGWSHDPQTSGIYEPIGPFEITVEYLPEPGMCALLAGGGLFLARRRG